MKELTDAELERIRWLLTLDKKKLERILDEEEFITQLVQRDRAYTLVLATLKRTAVWIAVISGSIAIGWDRIKQVVLAVEK